MLNYRQKQQLQDILLKKKQDLSSQINAIEEGGLREPFLYSIGELSAYDNHPADIGDELFERSKDIALRENSQHILDEVEKALNNIHKGSYGICQHCGVDIPTERLQAIPWANKCTACQREEENKDVVLDRPIEEQMLEPPFRRSFKDESDYNGFDGEDALQAVMVFGSSDTPQDIPGAKNYDKLVFNPDPPLGIVELTDGINDSDMELKEGNKRKSEP